MNTENFISLSRGVKPLDLVGTLPDNSLALEQRIHFAQQTIRNTMVKLGHLRRPDELLWALHNGGHYHAIGFARRVASISYGTATYQDITQEIRDGKIELREDDHLRFAITYPTSRNIGQGYIQLRYLRNDPISIAQMTRRALKNHENGEREIDRKMIARELQQLTREREQYERNHAANTARLEQKLATAHRRVGSKPRRQTSRVPVAV